MEKSKAKGTADVEQSTSCSSDVALQEAEVDVGMGIPYHSLFGVEYLCGAVAGYGYLVGAIWSASVAEE